MPLKQLCCTIMRTSPPKFCLVVLAVVLASSSSFAATVWKWVDQKGVTHYSDQPVSGAIQVDLSVQTYDSTEATIPATARRPRQTSTQSSAADYQEVTITSPTHEQTFTGTGGDVSVAVNVEPRVQSSDSVRLELDGLTVSEPNSKTTSFALKDVARGAHSLTASVVGRNGQVLMQSTPVTFFMQQTSTIHKKKN
jgi:hypothetical protein